MKFSPSTKLAIFSFGGVYLALAIIFSSLFVLRSEEKKIMQLDEIGATFFREPFTVNEFDLMDQYLNRFTLENMKGRWNIVFFGFTSCPDICPITMAELDRFARLWLEEDLGPLPQVIMTTVNPAVDGYLEMKNYLSKYNSDFLGLTGKPDNLAKFAGNFFVGFGESSEKEKSEAEQSHGGHSWRKRGSIDHSSHLSIVDPEGKFIAVMRPPHRSKDLVKALKIVTAKW